MCLFFFFLHIALNLSIQSTNIHTAYAKANIPSTIIKTDIKSVFYYLPFLSIIILKTTDTIKYNPVNINDGIIIFDHSILSRFKNKETKK